MGRKALRNLRAVLLLLTVFGVFFLSGCGQKEDTAVGGVSDGTDSTAEGPRVKVTFLDVGKGDAIFIETAEHTVLIDSGYDDTSGVLLNYMRNQDIYYLDYLIITHFDKDHVGGADWVLREVETGTVLQPDYTSDSNQYGEYVEAMEAKGLSPVLVTETMELSLDGVEFLIYPPQQKSYEEEDNDFSLVTSMVCGKARFLFAGDCERERLKELLAQKEFALSHDVLKVPHHGKKEKNSEEFLKAVAPKMAVITSSEEKPADDKICRTLEEMGTEVYFTENGAVTCLCDGKSVQVRQE
ncbi:MAG: MBL fold metallo-hydrolase [Clostridium sp.]|nr:MBL fold metallo-hydrolase [Clostridium sp.]